MTAHNVMTTLGGVLIVIGVGIMVYEMGKIWPQSKRRAAQDPDAPKPRLPVYRHRGHGRRRALGCAGVAPGPLGPA